MNISKSNDRKGKDGGYCNVGLGYTRKMHPVHRVIYTITHGEWDQSLFLDHIDGNRLNNKPENLRTVNCRENGQNKPRHRDGRLVGCYYQKSHKKWQARAIAGGKCVFLGLYNTEQEAHEAYVAYIKLIGDRVLGT